MAGDDLLEKGRGIQRQLWGERAGGTPGTPAGRLAPDFFRMVAEFCFGGFWARPQLDLRSRSLCTVAQLAALGRTQELKAHLMGARSLGISQEELVEVLMQTSQYAGIPAAVAALNAAAEVFPAD